MTKRDPPPRRTASLKRTLESVVDVARKNQVSSFKLEMPDGTKVHWNAGEEPQPIDVPETNEIDAILKQRKQQRREAKS